MNKKATGGFWKFIIISTILLIFIGMFYFQFITVDKVKEGSWDKLPSGFTDRIEDKLAGKMVMDNRVVVPPNEVQSWCQIQEFSISEDKLKPLMDGIIGYDTIEDCCVKRVKGVDQCLNRQIDDLLCFTSNIGGGVIYFSIDGFRVDDLYKDDFNIFINNLKKSENLSECSDIGKYPDEILR